MRTITFKIGQVQVTLTEDNGQIECDLVGLQPQTVIRGLFFDVANASILSGLNIDSSDVTSSKIANDAVTSFPKGITMAGVGDGTFDVGIGFGTAAHPVHATSFRLWSDTANLTLDDFANVNFGINAAGGPTSGALRTVLTTTAAPNAFNDSFNVPEDAVGLARKLTVLSNDTDADGNALIISAVGTPAHGGTVTIAADGKSIDYTPLHNYSGPDSFSYTISDGHGGLDTANVTLEVTPVADTPTLNVVLEAGDTADEIRVHVTTAVTDDSEFIDRLVFSGLPAGAQIIGPDGDVIAPGVDGNVTSFTAPAESVDQYFTLVMPAGVGQDFNLVVNSWSQESVGIPPGEEFGVETSANQSVAVLLDSSAISSTQTFSAVDQNIWATGDDFTFTYNQFLGLDLTGDNALSFNVSWDPDPNAEHPLFYATGSASIKAGLQPDIEFSGGEIDAQVPVDVTFAMDYNKTTDMLTITPSFLVADGAAFQVLGPEGHAIVDFILQADAQVAAGVDIGPVEIGPVEFGDPPPIDLVNVELGPYDYSQNLINLDSADLSLSHDFGFGVTGTLTWPDLDATGTLSGTTISSSTASDNFLALNLDVDQLAADLFLDGENPMDISESWDLGNFLGIVPLGSGTIDATLLDLDLGAGLNAIQALAVAMSGMTGTLTFEDQTTLQFSFADGPINIADALQHDFDGDGQVEFSVQLTPIATLDNSTSLGVNLNGSLEIASATVDVTGGALKTALDLAETAVELVTGQPQDFNPVQYGPLVDVGGEVQVATIPVYDDTFALNFQSQTVGDLFA